MSLARKQRRLNKNKQTQAPTHKPPLCPYCEFSVADPEMLSYSINSVESFVMIMCPHCKKFLNSCFRPTVLMEGVDPVDIEAAAKGQTRSGLIVPQSALMESRKREQEKEGEK